MDPPPVNIDSIFDDYDHEDITTPMNTTAEEIFPTRPISKARYALFNNATDHQSFLRREESTNMAQQKPFFGHTANTLASLSPSLEGLLASSFPHFL